MKKHSIKLRILFPLTLALTVLLVGFVAGSYKSERNRQELELHKKIQVVTDSVKSELKDDAHMMMAVLQTFDNDKQLKSAFREKDRNKLLALTKSLYDQLHSKHNITHFYFTDTQRVNLLRVHKPDKYGDVIDRHTMITAMNTGDVSYGIELGPLGTFTLRAVKPYYDEKGLIGYLELGQEIEHIIPKINKTAGVDLIVTIEKHHLAREKWENGMLLLGRNTNWNRYPDSVIIAQTLKEIPEDISTGLSDKHSEHFINHIMDVSMKNGRSFKGIFTPLSDVSGTTVGNLIIMQDITESLALTKNVIMRKIMFSLLIAVLLFTFFYFYISRVEAHIKTKDEESNKLYCELGNTNKQIDQDRQGFKAALDEMSSLIQTVTSNTDTSIRLQNPHLQNCWEIKNCKKDDCPSYGKKDSRCWQVAGTFCGGEVQGEFAQKYGNCSQCAVYKKATEDPIYEIGEQFNNMMHVIEMKSAELYETHKQLSNTQSQIMQQEKMASIGQLAAGVAHEINNPTGFISSNLGTLDKYISRFKEFIEAQSVALESMNGNGVVEELSEKKKKLKIDHISKDVTELINECKDGTDRIKGIVEGLKGFSRIDEASRKSIDINQCLDSTLNILNNELKYKCSLTKEFGTLPSTVCYPQQLTQVFVNLLVNASHAIEKQGDIKIKTGSDDNSIIVSISDTGSGIPEDKLKKIFEPFFTTKEVGKGTGLGLSISYDIVQKHGGELTVESEVGKGTTFNMRIPVASE